MTDNRDDLEMGRFQAAPRPGSGPEDWLGIPDPVAAFGSTIDQAMRQLALELAGIRAERDGLRLELEGLRAQLQVSQSQLADRERFASAVRDLTDIARRLQYPVGGVPVGDAPAAPAPAQPPPPQIVYVTAPPPPEPPVAEAPPAFQTSMPPEAPVATRVPPAAEPAVVFAAPPVTEPVAPPGQPIATPPPVFIPPAPPAEEVAPEPVVVTPPPPPAPEPQPVAAAPAAPPQAEPARQAQPEAADSTYRMQPPAESYAIETADNFFSQPGVWLGEPPQHQSRLDTVKKWGERVGAAIAVVVIALVSIIAIGPKFLPYQTVFVRSGSMHPTFDTGDMILLTKTDASQVKVGDVITFERPDKPGELVTHRVVAIETGEQGKQFQTKGDANGTSDAWRVPANGAGWKYKTRIPKLGFVFGYLGTPQARLALLAIPAVLLGLLSIIDIWKPQAKPRRGR